MRRIVIVIAAALLLMGTACGDDGVGSSSPTSPSATNVDGSPAAELITPQSKSIDDIRLANKRIAECARAAGLDATVDPNGEGVEVQAGADQTEPVVEIVEECQQVHGIPDVQYSQDELVALYEATVRQGECMEEHADVDLPEPPSAEVWIESQGGAWSPVEELGKALRTGGNAGQQATEAATIRQCPTPR